MAWATLDPVTRRQRLAYLASANWDHLTELEKELLTGTKRKPVSQGYAYLEQAKAEYRKTYPGESIKRSQLVAVVKQIDKQAVPGFYVDWLRGRQPLIHRFESMTLYTEAPAAVKAQFDAYIGSQAKRVVQAAASGNYNNSQLHAGWRNYVHGTGPNTLTAWLNDPEQAALRRWLEPFGPNFTASLVEP